MPQFHFRVLQALGRLLSVSRMKRLIEQETLAGTNAYGLSEMLLDLRGAIWSELDKQLAVGPFRRNLQRGYLERVRNLLESDEAGATDIVPLLRGELAAIGEAAGTRAAIESDRITRLHLEDVVSRVDRMLEPNE